MNLMILVNIQKKMIMVIIKKDNDNDDNYIDEKIMIMFLSLPLLPLLL